MKKNLYLDGKKRITLGKLISKDTTFFEVTKKSDGTLILQPKSELPENEIWIYKNKTAFKSIKKGLKDIKKGFVTKIDENIWIDCDKNIRDFKYTKEFLKNLEPFFVKNDIKFLEALKQTLEKINSGSSEKYSLQNFKTDENQMIFQLKVGIYHYIFWTERGEQKNIINLIENK